MIVIVVSGIALYKANREIRTENCDEGILESLHKDYMAELGCTNKYTTTNTHMESLKCAKEDIKFVWENNFGGEGGDEHGCINYECCDRVMGGVKIMFYIVAFSGLISGLALILTAMRTYSFQQSEMRVEGEYLKANILLKEGHLPLFVLVIAGLISVLIFAPKFQLFNAPQVEDYMKIDKLPREGDDLGKFKDYVNLDYIKRSFPLTSHTLNNQQENCEPDCDSFIYYVDVEGPSYGEITLEPKAYSNKRIIFYKKENHLRFKCRYEDVNPMLKMLRYRTSNITSPNKVFIEVNARYEPDFDAELSQYWQNRKRRLEGNLFESENPFHPIFKEIEEFEFFKDAIIIHYRGSVYSKEEPISNVLIEGCSPQFENRVICEGTTNDNGSFEIKLPILFDHEQQHTILPYMVILEFKKEGYLPMKVQINVGVFEQITEYELGSLIIIPETTLRQTVGLVFDTEDGKSIKGAEIKIDEDKVFTDDRGKFEDISCGEPIEVYKIGYYLYDKSLHCDNEVTIPLVPVLDDYRLRIVLTWTGPNKDLDLHTTFLRRSDIECKVGFVLTRCGGAIHQGDSLRNKSNTLPIIETLDLNTIGPYHYVFYVEDYLSKDIDSLEKSEANIEVYSGLEERSILSLNVPRNRVNAFNNETLDIYWVLFCFKGDEGIKSIKVVNKLTNNKPNGLYCQNFYNSKFMVLNVVSEIKAND